MRLRLEKAAARKEATGGCHGVVGGGGRDRMLKMCEIREYIKVAQCKSRLGENCCEQLHHAGRLVDAVCRCSAVCNASAVVRRRTTVRVTGGPCRLAPGSMLVVDSKLTIWQQMSSNANGVVRRQNHKQDIR